MPESILYAAVESALAELGFDVTVGPDYRLYHHAGTDTTIVTPDGPPEQAADALRLATVRRMVVDRGVARRERLERLLARPPAPRPTSIKRVTTRITLPVESKA
jgi:hypothetical protein